MSLEHRGVAKTWYANTTNADAQRNAADTIDYANDSAGRMVGIPTMSPRPTTRYDRGGNRTSRTNELRSALSETYQYNGVDALVSSVRNDSFDQSWTLDGLGNWSSFNDDGSSQARTANAANEIGSITGGWATPAYDPAGNMTVIPAPLAGDADHALGAKYDAWNHLVETSDGGVLVAKFSYDGAGRRIESLTNYVGGVPQQSTHYYLSGQNQVLETREGSPTTAPESLSPKYQNVWSPRYVDALILRDSYSGGLLQPASRLYYLSDANYNVTALVGKINDTWQAVERYAYTAYGKAAIYTPDWSSTRASSLYGNTTLYTGRELDASTSLYYYRARYYSADLGSFVGRDPLVYAANDANLYRYVENGPLTHADPFGLEKYLCIYSDTSANEKNPKQGHAGLMIGDTEDKTRTTYALWPDNNREIINAGLSDPLCSDVRTNFPLDTEGPKRKYPFFHCVKITDEQVKKLQEVVSKDCQWTYYNNCATFASEVFEKVTETKIDKDHFKYAYKNHTVHTPRVVTKCIKKLNKGAPSNLPPDLEKGPPAVRAGM